MVSLPRPMIFIHAEIGTMSKFTVGLRCQAKIGPIYSIIIGYIIIFVKDSIFLHFRRVILGLWLPIVFINALVLTM